MSRVEDDSAIVVLVLRIFSQWFKIWYRNDQNDIYTECTTVAVASIRGISKTNKSSMSVSAYCSTGLPSKLPKESFSFVIPSTRKEFKYRLYIGTSAMVFPAVNDKDANDIILWFPFSYKYCFSSNDVIWRINCMSSANFKYRLTSLLGVYPKFLSEEKAWIYTVEKAGMYSRSSNKYVHEWINMDDGDVIFRCLRLCCNDNACGTVLLRNSSGCGALWIHFILLLYLPMSDDVVQC